MNTRSRSVPAGCLAGSAALVIASGPSSTPLEGPGRALFGKGAGGFVEVLTEIELQWCRLHDDLALELLHVPAAGAHRRAHRERRVFRDLGGEIAGDFEMAAFGRHAVDQTGGKRLLGGEEAAGQCHLGGKGRTPTEIQQGPVFGAAEAPRGLEI